MTAAETLPHNTATALDQLQTDIQSVLDKSLSERLISVSPHQQTGNAYQAVRFGEESRKGFRKTRPNLLAGLDVKGKTVCDLGANLGEISRDLRRSGAALVDAYEYDPLFTQQARYITAYNGLYDINHLQADVSQPGFMRRKYDICVGLSAFSYMSKNIDYICQQTEQMMLIETHAIRDTSWPNRYVKPITKYFPHWGVFGVVSHADRNTAERRIWLIFSKRPLNSFYQARSSLLARGEEGAVEIDLDRSNLRYLDKITAEFGDGDRLSNEAVERYRTRLASFESDYAAGRSVDLSMAGVAYWLSFVCGVADFQLQGRMKPDNPYLTWARRGIGSGVIAPGLRPLLDDEPRFVERMHFRVAALGRAFEQRSISRLSMPIIFNPVPHHPDFKSYNNKTLQISGCTTRLVAPALDGYHRLFTTRLLGFNTVDVLMIWDPALYHETPLFMNFTNQDTRVVQWLSGVPVEPPAVV